MSGKLKIAVLYESSSDNTAAALGAPVVTPREKHKAKRPAPRKTKRVPKLARGENLSFPVIVKPCSGGGSVGIDAGSVVHHRQEMLERARLIQDELHCPALVEQYVEGRELYVGILGNDPPVALPLVELDLSRLPEGMPHIAGREVKWATETEAYKVTRSAIVDLDEQLAARAREAGLGAYRALQLRDYARIDLRLAADGKLYVIDANPNPWLVVEAEFALAAREAGRSYTELVGEIVEVALARYS